MRDIKVNRTSRNEKQVFKEKKKKKRNEVLVAYLK